MTNRWVVVAVIVALLGGVWVLRETTMTRHRPTPPGSTTSISFEVERHGGYGDIRSAAEALITTCVLDVGAQVAEPLEADGARFELSLQPALDDDERRKFTGCLGDWRVPHSKAEDIEIEDEGLDP